MMIALPSFPIFERGNNSSYPCGNVYNSESYARDCGKVEDFSTITAFPQGWVGDNFIKDILS